MSLLFSIALATIPALPEPVANNAVAKVVIDEQAYFLSFMGLSSGKAHTDVHNKVWVLKVGDRRGKQLKPYQVRCLLVAAWRVLRWVWVNMPMYLVGIPLAPIIKKSLHPMYIAMMCSLIHIRNWPICQCRWMTAWRFRTSSVISI